MKKSKEIALGWCGIGFSVVATVFHLIGFSSPHWLESFEDAHSRFDRWVHFAPKYAYCSIIGQLSNIFEISVL